MIRNFHLKKRVFLTLLSFFLVFFSLISSVAAAPLIPGWSCRDAYYGTNDGCDCGCGIPDPDCDNGGCTFTGCYNVECEYCFAENTRPSIGCPNEPVCIGSSTQSCTIPNGVGTQSRTCISGDWSSWSTCMVTSCDQGYIPNNDNTVCIEEVITNGLVSHYTFENSANDQEGSNDGQLMNGASIVTDLERGNVLSLDGTNDYVNFGNVLTFLAAEEATITMWFKTSSFSNTNPLITRQSENFYRQDYAILIPDSSSISYGYDDRTTGPFLTNWEVAAMQTDIWHHISFIMHSDNTVTVYLDGVFLSRQTGRHNDYSSTVFNIGRGYDIGDRGPFTYFDGLIDEVMIFNRALTEQEIIEIYGDELSPPSECISGNTESESCIIENGAGEQTRICIDGNWSDWSTCGVTSCDDGYYISGNECLLSSCIGSSTQVCTIPNGLGIQSRICVYGVWSSWSSCVLSSCDEGYTPNNDNTVCIEEVITNGLVSHYTFENSANDQEGSNDGQLMNGASIVTDLERGNVLSLDGTNDYVNFGNVLTFLAAEEATITMWFKTSSFSNTNPLITRQSENFYRQDYSISIHDSSSISYGYDDLSTGPFLTNWAVAAMQTDTWYHLSFIIHSDNTVTVYLDGVLLSRQTSRHNDYSSTVFNIGRGYDIGDRGPFTYFHGSIDEVRIFNKSLTEQEVIDLYLEELPIPSECLSGNTESESCIIDNGAGERTRTCIGGNWSDWSTCGVTSCNQGYIPNNNSTACVTCTPDCSGRVCGSDGCGGYCLPGCDPFTEICINGQCNLSVSQDPEPLDIGSEPTGYLTVAEIQSLIRNWSVAEPEIISYEIYGQTEDYDLMVVRMSAADSYAEQYTPTALVHSCIHGNEWIATASSLVAFHRLLSDYGSDDRVTDLFTDRVIYYIPVVNPVGYDDHEREEDGRDPNRAFPYPGNLDNSPTPSVAALKTLFEQKGFNATMDIHADGRMVFVPWSYTTEWFDEDGAGDIHRTVVSHIANVVGWEWGTVHELLGYSAPGDSLDWFFLRGRELGFNTFSTGLEVGTMQTPPASMISEEADYVVDILTIFIEEAPVAISTLS